jgi:hypothetical protein
MRSIAVSSGGVPRIAAISGRRLPASGRSFAFWKPIGWTTL